MFNRLVATIVAGAVAITAAASPARAQNEQAGPQLALIRDTEIEAIIRTFATPLWKAAGLAPSSVRVILVNDRSLNAFGLEKQLHYGGRNVNPVHNDVGAQLGIR